MINYVNTTINGLTLRGTAYVPDNITAPVPTVLLFHGFGAVRTEYFCSFVQISRLLAKSGIAAIAFDFSAHGESEAPLWISRLAMRFLRERSLFPL